MDEIGPHINITKSSDQRVTFKLPPDPNEWLRERYDFQTKIILGVFLVAFITMIIMVGGLLLEAYHFNSAVYKEYSEKINTLGIIQQSNKTNQQIIIDQQKQIQDLLKQIQELLKKK